MRAMRAARWAFFAAALIGIGVLASAEPDGASRLVSVQQLPDNMGVCTTWDQPDEASAVMASAQEQTLFSALQREPSPAQDPSSAPTRTAASQQDGAPQSDARQGAGQRGGGARFASGGASFVLPNTEEQFKRPQSSGRTERARRCAPSGIRLPLIARLPWTPTPTKSFCKTTICGPTGSSTACPRPRERTTEITQPKRIVQGDQDRAAVQ